jgi:hypothetical protein
LDNLPFFNPYESLEEQVFEQIGFFDRRKHGGRKTEELDVVVILKTKFKFKVSNKTKVLSNVTGDSISSNIGFVRKKCLMMFAVKVRKSQG